MVAMPRAARFLNDPRHPYNRTSPPGKSNLPPRTRTDLPMASITEAACLLETGAIYTRRAGFQRPDATDSPIFLGVKHGAFSLYFGDAPIYHFDLEGRWQRAFVAGTHYLKGLDGTVRAVERVREGENLVLRRRTLNYAQSADLDASIREVAIDLVEKTAQEAYLRLEPPNRKGIRPINVDDARELLERVARWDAAAWFSHRERYLATYGPIPFLPPESSNPLIVQGEIGQARGVTFGGGPAPHSAFRSIDEFNRHLEQVARLLGRRVCQSRLIFLAGDDLFRGESVEEASAMLEAVASAFPITPNVFKGKVADGDLDESMIRLEGIAACLYDFEAPRPTVDQWKQLRQRHLRSLTLGIESGCPDTRAALGRRWADDDLKALIADCRAAEIRVNLAVVANLGGLGEISRTADLVESLDLAPGEMVFLLDVRELNPSSTAVTLSDPSAEMRIRLEGLRSRKVKVVSYTLDKQWF